MTNATPSAAATTGDEALVDAMVQTSYAVVNLITEIAARHELSLTLLRVIAILRDRTPAMSELASRLGLDRSSITGLVDRAIARGLLSKISDDQDRRSSRVTLTGAGQALAESCAEEITREFELIVVRLTPTQRGNLTRLLEALGVVE